MTPKRIKDTSSHICIMILLSCLLVGCMTERRAADKINYLRYKYPTLFSEKSKTDTIIKTDTLTFVNESLDMDTILTTMYDTIVVDDGRILTEVRIKRSGILNTFRVRTNVKSDSFKVVVRDTLFRTQIEKKVVTEIRKDKKMPLWGYVIVLLSILVASLSFGYLLQRYPRNRQTIPNPPPKPKSYESPNLKDFIEEIPNSE